MYMYIYKYFSKKNICTHCTTRALTNITYVFRMKLQATNAVCSPCFLSKYIYMYIKMYSQRISPQCHWKKLQVSPGAHEFIVVRANQTNTQQQ